MSVKDFFAHKQAQKDALSLLRSKPKGNIQKIFDEHVGIEAENFYKIFSVVRNALEESHSSPHLAMRDTVNIPELHPLEMTINAIMKLDAGEHTRKYDKNGKELGPFTVEDTKLLGRFQDALQTATAFYEREAQNAAQLQRCVDILNQNPHTKIVKKESGYTLRNGEVTHIFSHPMEVAFLDRISHDAASSGMRIAELAEPEVEETTKRAHMMLALLPELKSQVRGIFTAPTSTPQTPAPEVVVDAPDNLGRLMRGNTLSDLVEDFPIPDRIREHIEQKVHYNLGGGSMLAQFIMSTVHFTSRLYTRGLASATGRAFNVEDMKQLEQLLESVRHLENGRLSGTDTKRFASSPDQFISIAERLEKTQDPEATDFARMIREMVPPLKTLAQELASSRSIRQGAPGS